jgi:hypothetical protein
MKSLYSKFFFKDGILIYQVYIEQAGKTVFSKETNDHKEYAKIFYDMQKSLESATTVPFEGKFDSYRVA